MNNDELIKLLPIVGTIVSIIGGLVLSGIEDRKQTIKDRAADTNTQELMNQFADDYKKRSDSLEAENRELWSRVRTMETTIATLQSQMNMLMGGSAYAIEGDHAIFMG